MLTRVEKAQECDATAAEKNYFSWANQSKPNRNDFYD